MIITRNYLTTMGNNEDEMADRPAMMALKAMVNAVGSEKET